MIHTSVTMRHQLLLAVLVSVCSAGGDIDKHNVINLRAKQITQKDSSWPTFSGNHSGEHAEYLTVLQTEGDNVLLGARDVVYNLSLSTLQLNQKLVWQASDEDVSECVRKGKSTHDCHNYIRIMCVQSAGRTLVCGTNAYKPTCRQYAPSMQQGGVQGYQMLRQFDGYAITPFHPRHNSTAVLVSDGDGDAIYSGTVTDFGDTDALVYRRTLSFSANADMAELRTRRDDRNVLNNVNFVASIARGEYVYVFFRETAVEHHQSGHVYSRVARVCRKDQGGRPPFSDSWTSFVKARLSCKLPDDQPFMFDQLQSMSSVVHLSSGAVVYGVFTSGENALRMSAVCAYRLDDIDQVFDQGSFLATPHDVNAPWLPVLKSKLPDPESRPAKCVPNSRLLSDESVNFVQRNMLMADSVSQRYPAPLIIDNSMKGVYTCVSVAASVRAVNGQLYDVVYVGTSDGRMHKLLRTVTGQSILIETVQVLSPPRAIRQLVVHEHHVLVVSDELVVTVPVAGCQVQNTCAGCVRLHDPRCAWSTSDNLCVDVMSTQTSLAMLTQSVDSGRSPLCPEGDYDPSMYAVNDMYAEPGQQRSLNEQAVAGASVSASGNVAVAVVLTLAIASTVGFLLGYRVSVWKQQQQHNSSAGSSTISSCDYDSSSLTRARLTRTTNAFIDPTHPKLAPLPGLLQGTSSANVYASPPSCTRVPHVTHHDPLANIRLQHALHSPSGLMTGSMTLSRAPAHRADQPSLQLAAAVANGTLPRDYKVKRAYV